MSGLGDLWRRMTGGNQPLEHCAIHLTFQPECPTCVRLNQERRQSWQVETYSPVEPIAFFDPISAGDPVNTSPDVSAAPDFASSDSSSSSGFDGFDGGSSGGGGASGDW